MPPSFAACGQSLRLSEPASKILLRLYAFLLFSSYYVIMRYVNRCFHACFSSCCKPANTRLALPLKVISGDTQGKMFQHLRASRQLILSLRVYSRSLPTDSCRQLFGFMCELYAYLVLANTLTPHAAIQERTIVFDSFIIHLDEIGESVYRGIMLGGLHGLLELIPLISVFAASRLREDAVESDSVAQDRGGAAKSRPVLLDTYRILKARIDGWSLPPLSEQASDSSIVAPTTCAAAIRSRYKERRIAGEVYRHALYIYLSSSMAGQLCTDQDVRASLHTHACAILDLVTTLSELSFDYTMLWPVIICGSCLTSKSHQDFLLAALDLGHVKTASNLLKLLWDDPDPRAFGSYGLYFVIEKYKINFCAI
jgi:hypothetical protein